MSSSLAQQPFKLSVVTVCLNAKRDLLKTHDSIANQTECDLEFIVVDGLSTDGTQDLLTHSSLVSAWVSEKDKGIYDAMNKGIGMANGDGILFLNAGDYIVGDLLKYVGTAPLFLPVITRTAGVFRPVQPKDFRMGLPYCHQGIIFENRNIFYDLNFKLAADYDFYLRHGYREIESIQGIENGFVFYDNSGLSQQKFWRRDCELAEIILKNFGRLAQVKFLVWAALKGCLKLPFVLASLCGMLTKSFKK